ERSSLHGAVVELGEGKTVPLSAPARALLERMLDGTESDSSPDRGRARAELSAAGLLVQDLEVPLGPAPLESLRALVDRFGPGAAKDRWAPRLRRLSEVVAQFASQPELDDRRRLLGELWAVLSEAGVAPRRSA